MAPFNFNVMLSLLREKPSLVPFTQWAFVFVHTHSESQMPRIKEERVLLTMTSHWTPVTASSPVKWLSEPRPPSQGAVNYR